MNAQQPTTAAWHTLDLPTLFTALEATEKGLTDAEAAVRLARFGPNQLPRQPAPTVWGILLRQFRSPLIYILGIAALVSVSIGELTDAAFIAAVLGLNAAIGGYQEWRAERSARALQQLLRIRATVEREHDVREIDAEGVVPGDVVWLESGNRVPADVRLLTARGLQMDESLLTGESFAVLKDPAWTGEAFTPLADHRNMAYAGSIVVRGRGRGLVAATGMATAVGQLALDVFGAGEGKPPLLVRMERFTRVVAMAVLAAALVVIAIGIIGHGRSVTEMVLFGIAMAVSAIPEGLPIALTVALAIGATRMARRGVIIRRLAAVEGLGSCTLIASDKTGTLTCNELTVREIRLPDGAVFQVTGEGFAPQGQILFQGESIESPNHLPVEALARCAVLCNEADLHHRDGNWVWRGDPTDIALLSMVHKLGWKREATLDRYPQVNQIPFEPERQFAASYHRMHDGRVQVFVKGAPERVLAMCTSPANPVSLPTLPLQTTAEAMAAQGYRVLALAQGTVPDNLDPSRATPEPSGLAFLGFVGMIDPLRPGVREAVAACHQAGVSVSMITGDHPVTALAIARDLGLATHPEQVVTGPELQGKSVAELKEFVTRARVFARVAPRQKLELVEAAMQAGHFVAVTGDGVNDAPALRTANIGVAMGKSGTDVAREAAELVISDDNFTTIVTGIEEGRVAYDNVRKVTYLLVSTGAAEVVLIVLAVAMGTPLPLLPVQLLWLNLVTNGIQDVALAFEPSEGGVLRRKPRPPREPIFNRIMIERTILAAIVMGCVGFAVFLWLLESGWNEGSARNALLLLLVLFQNIHIANCRSETKSAFRLSPLRNPILLVGVVIAQLIHVAMLYLPVGHKLLRTEPVDFALWLTLLGFALTILFVMEIHKWAWARRERKVSSV